MSEITCRRTKWRKADTWPPEYVYDRGYYYGGYGPFKSEEAARLHKEGKEIEARSGEDKVVSTDLEIENLRFQIKELNERIKKLEAKS